MNYLPRLRRVLCVVIVCLQWSVIGQGTPIVSKIDVRHVGPASVSDSLVRANIRVKEGEAYRRASVDDDVKNLYATGYFYNIRVAEEITPQGINLTYVVQGKPLLTDITFSGNKKFSDKKLRKKLTSKVGEPLDERKLFFDSQEIYKSYQKAGYQKTTVKPVPTINENAGRGTVTFEVTETPKVKIKDIQFVGAESFSPRKLRKQLKTKRRWMFSWLTGSGVLKDEQFEDDKDKLIEFYQEQGFIDAELKDVNFDYIEENKMIVRFVVDEGKKYQVGEVDIKGNSIFTDQQLTNGVPVDGKPLRMRMLTGETFTPGGLNKDVEAIKDIYGSRGYLAGSAPSDTKINPVKSANTQTGTMDVNYQVTEGDQSYIEKVEIRGNTKTKDKVIRRELAVAPGEVFDTVKVKMSKTRLEQMQFFEKVDTQPEDTDVPGRKNLVVGVEEKNTGSFTIGAGLSSVDSVVGFAEFSQGNFDLFKPPTFTGAGQKFRLRVSVGLERQDYQINFVEPWFLGRKLALGVDLFHREFNFLSDLYDQTETGGSLSLTRALGSEFLIGKVAYTLENIDININDPSIVSPELLLENGSRLVSKVGTSIAYDTRNNVILPSRGQRSELAGEVAGGPFGADVDFWKVEARTTWFWPGFFEGHIFETHARSGVVDYYGNGDRGMPRVPIFDRWFLGGLYSLRGYRYRTIRPKDSFGEPIGGQTYWFGSAEYSIPIIERLRFALFYDVGNVYSGAFNFQNDWPNSQDFLDYVDNWGIGLRLNLPIGPIRLDYGFPMNHPDNVSGSGRFQFGVGYHREF